MIQLTNKETDLNIIHLPFFAQEKYLSTKSDNYGWFCSENFILPFVLYKNYIFKRIVFTNEVLSKNDTNSLNEQEFLDEVMNYIKINKVCDFIYKPSPNAVFKTYPKNSDYFKWASYVLTPNTSLDNMINKITTSSERTKVRKAIKDGIEVEFTDDYKTVYDMCNGTLSRQNIQLGIDKEEFYKQFRTLFPNDMLMFKATYKDEIQAVLVVFKDKNNAYAKYCGRILKPYIGSVRLLNLISMKYLVDIYNIKSFDFIGAVPDIIKGTKECRIQKFKKEFGATLKEGYQFRMIINSFKYNLFNFLIKSKLKLKRIDYIDPVERDKKLSESNLKV